MTTLTLASLLSPVAPAVGVARVSANGGRVDFTGFEAIVALVGAPPLAAPGNPLPVALPTTLPPVPAPSADPSLVPVPVARPLLPDDLLPDDAAADAWVVPAPPPALVPSAASGSPAPVARPITPETPLANAPRPATRPAPDDVTPQLPPIPTPALPPLQPPAPDSTDTGLGDEPPQLPTTPTPALSPFEPPAPDANDAGPGTSDPTATPRRHAHAPVVTRVRPAPADATLPGDRPDAPKDEAAVPAVAQPVRAENDTGTPLPPSIPLPLRDGSPPLSPPDHLTATTSARPVIASQATTSAILPVRDDEPPVADRRETAPPSTPDMTETATAPAMRSPSLAPARPLVQPEATATHRPDRPHPDPQAASPVTPPPTMQPMMPRPDGLQPDRATGALPVAPTSSGSILQVGRDAAVLTLSPPAGPTPLPAHERSPGVAAGVSMPPPSHDAAGVPLPQKSGRASASTADAAPLPMPVANPVPPAAPARQVFAGAMFDVVLRERVERPAPDPAPAALTGAQPVPATDPAAAAAAAPAIDMTRPHWPAAMVDRIERLREAADAGDTRIRLMPDALGSVEVAVRQVGDAVHVRFTAAEPETRQLIADAQGQLARAAEERGVRLGQTEVSGGSAGSSSGGGGRQPDPGPHGRSLPGRPRPATSEATEPSSGDRLSPRIA